MSDRIYHAKTSRKISEIKYFKQWSKSNLEEFKKYSEKYLEDDYIEKINECFFGDKKQYMKTYVKNKRKTNLKYNLNCRMVTAIGLSLKGNKAGRHWEDLVGYTLNDLIKHLKKTMPPYYCWKDFLEAKLEVDHIYPIAIFNFTKPNDYDFQRCWSLKNLRLLPKRENRKKRDKLTKPFQPALQI